MAEDDAPKSAYELILERLRKKDREEGVEERPLGEEQKARIAEIRKVAFVIRESALIVRGGTPDLAGTIEIQTSAVDIEGSVAALTDAALDASDRLVPRCSARRRGETAGSFVVAGASLSRGPEGWLDGWSGSAAAPSPFAQGAGGCR